MCILNKYTFYSFCIGEPSILHAALCTYICSLRQNPYSCACFTPTQNHNKKRSQLTGCRVIEKRECIRFLFMLTGIHLKVPLSTSCPLRRTWMPSLSMEPKAMYSPRAQSIWRFFTRSARPRRMRDTPGANTHTHTMWKSCMWGTLWIKWNSYYISTHSLVLPTSSCAVWQISKMNDERGAWKKR